MSNRDYYEVLGVAKDADENAIKRAYRKLAMKYHPDRNPGDDSSSEKFREVTEAYEVLTDSGKRARYDQYGHAGVDEQMQDFWGRGGAQDSHAFRDFGDMFGDVFGDMFGGRGGARTARGADLRYNLTLTLEEAASGREVELKIPKHESCTTCKGSGARPGSNPVPCNTCGGHGQVQMQQGFFAVRRTCPTCQGAGTRIDSPCLDCGGAGRVKVTKKLKIKVPAGVYDGAQVRVSGEGESGQHGSPAGDLYVVIALKAHSIFEREGADLYCTMPVTFPQATLGAEVDAPTLHGRVKIKIPAGTEGGRVFRLRGHGVPDVRAGSQKGDLYVRVQIAVPKKMSSRQEQLLREFANEAGDDVYPERSSFLGKVKDFWGEISNENKP
ncbi:MAG: molecular chaperone DnaJ [Zetaproteobacteria bacterium CG1_02_53_45]|nr:MAG: molecular chaperone DnaJ [Zetaproteobacteria bacterium CG1_02_53_45]